MTEDEHASFPVGAEFLELQRSAFEATETFTKDFSASAGIKLPATVENLGSVLSFMYRAACCAWGCQGGDHQLEWLIGRVVNQANAAYQLIQYASYDESLVLTRGIGEIANLLWLFQEFPTELKNWQGTDKRARLQNYGPAAVRKKLVGVKKMGPPIDNDRYQRLCEVGTHPVPALAPSHFTASGRPILSGMVQHVGIYVCMTELGFAAGMCGVATSTIVLKDERARQRLFDSSIALVRSLGAFTILNYEELLAKAMNGEDPVNQVVH
jgi:hypothetical protein